MDLIDNATLPEKMEKDEALKYLQDIQSELTSRIEALEAEIDENE